MVEINMGVSLMMQRAAEFFKTEEVVIVPLEEEVVSEFSLVRKQKRDLVQAANLFWEYMQSSCIS
jgi:DNA-binding transcriptional LysR family regulator